MLLDDFLPRFHFNEVHTIAIKAPLDKTFLSIKELAPLELSPLFHIFFKIRALPGRLMGKGDGGFLPSTPLLDQMLEGGFVLLAESPDREIVFGTIGQFWKLSGGPSVGLADAKEFVQFDRPDYAKVAGNFYVSECDGKRQVGTESRIYVADPKTRKKFANYWRVIYPGSSYIRKLMLKAIKRRAEQSFDSV